MPRLQVVGYLMPTAHQRVLIREAREWDIATTLGFKWKFYDHQAMKTKPSATFFEDELNATICNLIFHPQHRGYLAKTMRYQQ